jgi:tetratricopeptide (TPR) repeat protein
MNSNPTIELHGPVLNEAPPLAPSLSIHQLPTPPADFTGRTKELNELVDKIRFEGISVVGVFGMGGVGKTSLALKLAEELTPRYPDAQLFLDLKGAGGPPLTVAEIMAHVVRAYEPASPIPSNAAELEGKYRSVLNERRIILFLDNAVDRDQIHPLMPSEECLLLITSRNRFPLPGMFEKDLETLPPQDARELAMRIAPRLEGRVDEMVQLCGYLPLAVRGAANMLAEHRDLSVDNCMRRLSQIHERRALVNISIAPSYEALSPELRKLWRLLSVFPDGFDSTDAGTIWGMGAGPAQDFLSVLLAGNMLQWCESLPTYRMHDLFRIWAIAQCSDEERQTLHQVLAEYGATTLARAGEMYFRGGDDVRAALDLFDAERPNIESGWKWVSAHAEQDEWADLMCARYPVVGSDLLNLRQTARERVQWLQAPLASARRAKDCYVEASLLTDLGSAHCRLGEFPRAVECHMQSLTLAREIGAKKIEERALRGLGFAYCRKTEYPQALEFHEKALALAREIKDVRGECECIRELAGDYQAMDASSHAITVCEKALAIARETGDRCAEAECLGDLAAAHGSLGEQMRVVGLGEEALLIAREIRDRRTEGTILGTLGRGYAELGDTRRAIECHEAHLKIARETGDRYGEGYALGNLGNALARSGDARSALQRYQELLRIVRELGDRSGEATVLGYLGKARARLGETRVAIECLSEQLAIAREIGDRRTEGSALWNTSLALNTLGDRVQAITHAEAARKIFEDAGDAESARIRKQLEEWGENKRRAN